jgi:site-specific DNA recombinase
MIAAIYARKSTDQDDAKSVRQQIEHGRAFAARHGWTVAEGHVYQDDSISGAEFNGVDRPNRRPGLKRLMDALSPRPPFQVLVVYEESRLGREQIETAWLLKQFVTGGAGLLLWRWTRADA